MINAVFSVSRNPALDHSFRVLAGTGAPHTISTSRLLPPSLVPTSRFSTLLLDKGARVALVANPANGGGGIARNDGVIDGSANANGGVAGELLVSGKYAGNFGTILALGS